MRSPPHLAAFVVLGAVHLATWFLPDAIAGLIGYGALEPVRVVSATLQPVTCALYIRKWADAKARAGSNYVRLLLLGMWLCTLGSFFIVATPGVVGGALSPRQLFLAGVGSYAVAQALFAIGFSMPEGAVRPRPCLVWVLPFALAGYLIWTAMQSVMPAQMIRPIAVYTVLIMAMGWRAAARWMVARGGQGLALWGAVIFIVSDAVIAFNKWGVLGLDALEFKWARLIIALTYWAAIALIAEAAASLPIPSGGALKKT